MSYTKLVSLSAAAPGLLGLTMGPVLAASDGRKKGPAPASMSLEELPSLYNRPEVAFSAEPPSNAVEEKVSVLRAWIQPHSDQCQRTGRVALDTMESVYKWAEPAMNSSLAAATGVYEFVCAPPSHFFPSLASIGFSGFLGLYFAKGSRVKRVVFPLGLVALTSSMFYPQPAAALLQVTRAQAWSLYHQSKVTVENFWKDPRFTRKKVEVKDDTSS